MTTPTPTTALGADDIVDLTQAGRPATQPLRFRIDADTFEAAAKVPVGHLTQAINLRGNITGGDLEPVLRFLDAVLYPHSAQIVRARAVDVANPIDHTDLLNVLNHLIERWGMRPTEPSPNSSTPSGDGTSGTSSPAGAQPAALTL